MLLQSIDTTTLVSEHPSITKRTSVSKVILSLLLMLVGLAALISSNQVGKDASTLSVFLMFSGVLLIILGVSYLVWRSKETIYTPTGSVMKKKSFFFDLKHLDDLKNCILFRTFPLKINAHSEPNGNIRLDVVFSADKKFAAVQLFQFVPYAYNPVSLVHYYADDDVTALASFLAQSGCKVYKS